MSMLRKQTKSENILNLIQKKHDLILLGLQTDQSQTSQTKQIQFDWSRTSSKREATREQHCYHGDCCCQTNDIFTESVSFIRW